MSTAEREVDYYRVLGVADDASTTEIRAAYRSMAKAVHPDVGGDDRSFALLRKAYETLRDPRRRAGYDRRRGGVAPVRYRDGGRFRVDPDFDPPRAWPEPDAVTWWREVDPQARVRYRSSSDGLLRSLIGKLGREAGQEFAARVHGTAFGVPRHRAAEQTAELIGAYLTRIPAVRVFHGLALPGSVFSDVDHAVLAGRKLALLESKSWLPGCYRLDGSGVLWRDGHRFRGGTTALPDAVRRYRSYLGDVDVRGAVVVYPSRSGSVEVDVPGGPPVSVFTPHRLVEDIGGWLAADPVTVDRAAFRRVRVQVVS